MTLTKERKASLVLRTMHWHAEHGRHVILQDTLYVGPTRALVKSGLLLTLRDRAGQWCVCLPGGQWA